MRRVMVRMAMVDGALCEAEVARVRWNVGRLTGTTPSEERVRRDAAQVHARGLPLDQFLEEIGAGLGREDRRTLVQAAYIIATADGAVPEAEDRLLVALARSLEVSPSEYRALVSPMALARALDGS